MRSSRLGLGASALLFATGLVSRASATGVCDANPPTSTQACIDAIQANGSVVNDVFHDTNGLTAFQLPVYGQLFNAWPGCDMASFAGCSGQDTPPYDCPGQYTCSGAPNTFANASQFLAAPDHTWWHPCRLADHTLVNGCPQFNACIADGVGGAYFPWEGLVFDLGGPSNKVVIFATNDHGPQPCESTEYTVYLSDNPFATEIELAPTTNGIDPNKWNRAVLNQIFTKGWDDIRAADPAGHAACGDTALYAVEQDSFATVYQLPCGVTFRYASIVAGNDGLDFPECAFDSNEGEIDAVAGLTESGAAVCNDADNDHYVDCNCIAAPPVCDCDDSDEDVHPGAPEACDSPDLNCDGDPGACGPGLFCNQSICIPPCAGGEFDCPPGSTCETTPDGDLCVPADCSVGGCPPGTICVDDLCVPACDDVVCPGTQVCLDGQCVDPCANMVCPGNLICQAGECVAPCSCYAQDLGCTELPGTVCDAGTDTCVPPLCEGVTCPPLETCDADTGMCVTLCDPSVMCPLGQKCVEPDGCVPACTGVECDAGFECDPQTGECVDLCNQIECLAPLVCVAGQCVEGAGGGGGGGAGGAPSEGGGGSTASAGGVGAEDGDEGGCSCRVGAGPREGAPGAALVAVAAALLVAQRRRRRLR